MSTKISTRATLAPTADEHLAARTCRCVMPQRACMFDLVRCRCDWWWLMTGWSEGGHVVWRLMKTRESNHGGTRSRALLRDTVDALDNEA